MFQLLTPRFVGVRTIGQSITFTAFTNRTKCSLDGIGGPSADIILKTGYIYSGAKRLLDA